MQTASATDYAIALAHCHGTLRVSKEVGRFGEFVAISDEHGLIEVCLNRDEAAERIKSVVRNAAH